MRKIVALALAMAAIAIGAPSSAVADDVRGPTCGDVVGGAGSYLDNGSVGITVEVADHCNFMEYTLFIQTAEGTQQLSPAAVSGNQLIFQTTVNPATNPSICVHATTSVGNGHHVFDRAPDAGCQLHPKGIGGWSSFS